MFQETKNFHEAVTRLISRDEKPAIRLASQGPSDQVGLEQTIKIKSARSIKVEHRHYFRKQISLEVDLYKKDRFLGRGLVKDISIGGLMLQNERRILSRNEIISLRFWLSGVEQIVRGFVVHTNKTVAGVMLIDINKDLFHASFGEIATASTHRRLCGG